MRAALYTGGCLACGDGSVHSDAADTDTPTLAYSFDFVQESLTCNFCRLSSASVSVNDRGVLIGLIKWILQQIDICCM